MVGPKEGDTPTVVLCDGIGCDGYVWRYLRPALARSYRVVHWHYRGHGRSGAPRDPTRIAIADLADDLAEVLTDAGVDRAAVFGHSMGVQVSLETYRRHPERVVGLGLVCGAPGRPLSTFKGSDRLERLLPVIRAIVRRTPGIGLVTRALVPTRLSYAIATQLEVNGVLLEARDFMPYLEHLGHIDLRFFTDLMAEAGRHDATELLPRIDVPTLIVAGTRDGFTPASLSRAMHEAIPGSTLLLIEPGSHTAPLERPHLVEATTLPWLRDLFVQRAD